MKKYLSLLITSIMLLIQGAAYAIMTDHPVSQVYVPPLETIVLKFNSYANWKEIYRDVDEKEGTVLYIPFDQIGKNFSEWIIFSHNDLSTWDKQLTQSIEKVIEPIRNEILDRYPRGRVSWKIIEKNKNDIIYEWFLHEPHEDIPPAHEIGRCFLTESEFHQVAFTSKNAELSTDKRENWIELLKKSASVVSFEEATNAYKTLSMVDRFKDSLDLDSAVQNWRVSEIRTLSNGHTLTTHIPPSQKISTFETECLDVLTMPNLVTCSIDQLFETEKKNLQRESLEKIEFQILKKSRQEIIYACSHPLPHLQLITVARIFISDKGSYCVRCRCRFVEYWEKEKISRFIENLLVEYKKKELILQWKERLEAIRIRIRGI